jgi:replication factor C subunit 2/4
MLPANKPPSSFFSKSAIVTKGLDGDAHHKSVSSQPWIEKYRPKTIQDVSAQGDIVSVLKEAAISGNLPHLLFYGPPGTGKTSTILALCRDMFGEHFKERVLELNASDERGIAVVREKVKDFARTLVSSGTATNNASIFDGKDGTEFSKKHTMPMFKIIILDEADSMTFDAQAALRRTMETYSATTRFCIICNYVHKIIEPLASRCAKFRFKSIDPENSKQRLSIIGQQEGFSCDDDALDLLVKRTGGDLRKAINYLQSAHRLIQFPTGSGTPQHGKITVDMIQDLTGIIPNVIMDPLFNMTIRSNSSGGTISLDNLQTFISENIILQGYSITQCLYQLQEALVYSSRVSSAFKSIVSIKMASTLKNLIEGADGHLQLLDLVTFMHINSPSPGSNIMFNVMNSSFTSFA